MQYTGRPTWNALFWTVYNTTSNHCIKNIETTMVTPNYEVLFVQSHYFYVCPTRWPENWATLTNPSLCVFGNPYVPDFQMSVWRSSVLPMDTNSAYHPTDCDFSEFAVIFFNFQFFWFLVSQIKIIDIT